MASAEHGSPTHLIELDLDLRLGPDVWSASPPKSWQESFWALLRIAYARGYCDALTEPTVGKLFLDHGMTVPKRPTCMSDERKRSQ